LAVVGPGEARNLRYGIGAVFGNGFEMLLYNGLGEALAIALAVVLAYMLVLGSIRNWVFLWVLIDLYLFASIGAGRTLIVQGGIYIVVLAILRSTLQARDGVAGEGGVAPAAPARPRKNLIVYVAVPAVVMTAFMVYLTFARIFSLEAGTDVLQDTDLLSLVGEAFLDNVGVYAVGPFRALDYALSHPSIVGFHFGRLTFAAVDEVIGVPLRLFGIDYPIMNREIATIIQDDVIFIGSTDFNALYTGVFRFYYDFGVPGVAVLSFLFGAVLRGSVQWFRESPSVVTLGTMLYLFGAAVLATQTWHLASTGALVFLAGAYLAQRAARASPAPSGEKAASAAT
jgi:oligosaccharide repeat unit polymerase